MPICHACGAEIPRADAERIGRRDTCGGCGAELHVCCNCRFYAPGMHNDCGENQAERVVEKRRSNFCEYFAPGEGARATLAPARSDARGRLDNLFKKRSE